MTRRRHTLAVGFAAACALWAPASFALDPAGGPPAPHAPHAPSAERTPDTEAPDASAPSDEGASGEEAPSADNGAPASGSPPSTGSDAPRSWLSQSGREGPKLAPAAGGGSGLTFGALSLLIALGAGAVVLHMKRKKQLPIPSSDARVNVLSSSRIGPKAFAVTAHVGGRVMLLGVTDHTVTHLGWLDAPENEAEAVEDEAAEADEPGRDELPADYPGSALRASERVRSHRVAPAAPMSSTQLATARDLKRFQEVLRGVASRPAPLRRNEPASEVPSAAATLAAQTSDILTPTTPLVVSATAAEPNMTGSTPPNSLRRKRQRRQESLSPNKLGSATPSETPAGSEAPSDASKLEGQVAGLRAAARGTPR